MVQNPLVGAIKSFYPEEFNIASHALIIIKNETGFDFPIDEVGFITIHFVTAALGVKGSDFSSILTFVNEISDIVKEALKISFDESSLIWQRFLIHLSFLAKRLIIDKNNEGGNYALLNEAIKQFPITYDIVKLLSDFIYKKYEYIIPEEEQMYLMLHINRLASLNSK